MIKLNRVFIIIAVLFALPIIVCAQAQQEAPKPCFEVIGTADYDFGTIEQSESVRHVYEFQNNCKDTIHIANAQASCGCTAAIVSEKDIPPGGKAAVDVKFHPPAGTRGKVSKTVSVYLKDNPAAHTILRFSAKVATDIETDPQYVQLLGAQIGKEVTGKVAVKNVTNENVELAEITASMTAYADTSATPNSNGANNIATPVENVKLSPKTKILKPNESADITISLVPKYPGQVNGSIIIKTKKAQSYIQVFGVVRGADTSTTTVAPSADQSNKKH